MSAAPTTDDVWRVLATIPDPEFGLSIVDLGLIYEVKAGGGDIHTVMTLTSRTCPAGERIHAGVHAALAALPGVTGVNVELVWKPAWTPNF